MKPGPFLMMAMLVTSTSAVAAPLSLWVGQSKALSIAHKVSKIRVSDPSLVAVETLRDGAELRGLRNGIVQVELRTVDGLRFAFEVRVTTGAEIYSTNRAAPEHGGDLALSSGPTPAPHSKLARRAAGKAHRSQV